MSRSLSLLSLEDGEGGGAREGNKEEETKTNNYSDTADDLDISNI